MDLKSFIAQLRAELENLDQVISAMEKLREIRNVEGDNEAEVEAPEERPSRKRRKPVSSPPSNQEQFSQATN